eukprot:361747-Chlamydomonas_euryale.AAC.7
MVTCARTESALMRTSAGRCARSSRSTRICGVDCVGCRGKECRLWIVEKRAPVMKMARCVRWTRT